jgi:hypothetical protein
VPFSGAAPAYAAGPDPQGTIYVADNGTSSIDVFAPGSNGNVAPERVISGPDTGLNGPGDVKVDANGDVYVSNFSGDSITEYAPGASGDASPICTISGSNTGLDANDDMSVEADGTLVVGNFVDSAGDNGSVVVFPPGACGNVTPVETIEGSNTGFNTVDGVGTDAAGTIYADSSVNSAIEAFPAGANGNVSPQFSITGPDTGLGYPDDIIVGFNGEIYATNGFGGPVNSVTVFAPGASGDATPIQNITGPNTDFGLPDDLSVDQSGDIYVTDSEASVGPAVLEFASGATGDVAPTAVIAGSATTLSVPEGVAVAGPQSTQSATMSTSVSAPAITLGQSTSDTATLSGGTDAPTGSIVFKLFGPNDPTCSNAPAFTSAEQPVNGDGNYDSPSFTPTEAGAYSWQDLYSGDGHNAAITSACNDPHETVTVGSGPAPTSVSTSLSGGGHSGATISVPPGTGVTDAATLTGANVSTAGGTLTYNAYSDSNCTTAAGSPDTVTVTSGSVPASAPVTLTTPGTYYWTASYSGDSGNGPSASECGSETETVTTPQGKAPTVDTHCSEHGTTSVTDSLTPSKHGELVVDYVTAGGPASGPQSVTVSGSGLTWTRVARENSTRGDAEVWVAHAGTKSPVNVTAKAAHAGFPIAQTEVAYHNATGIGASGTFFSASGAPTGTIATTQDSSRVWGVGFDPAAAKGPTPGPGQKLFTQTKAGGTTSWVQSVTQPTSAAGTSVTINDTAPATDPYNLVVVEIS